jgi:hypothetical protein
MSAEIQQTGAASPTPEPPILMRLDQHRGKLMGTLTRLVAFERRLNGDSPASPDGPKGDLPPQPIEAVMQSIEQLQVELEGTITRIASRI